MENDEDEERFLILCSDGLIALTMDEPGVKDEEQAAQNWVNAVGKSIDSPSDSSGSGGGGKASGNLALDLLRSALGGEDTVKVSRSLTVEKMTRWMDDTTVMVIRL